jgi:hypothetical protein
MSDRFDITEAYYCYLSAYHSGQNSKEYARLSRMLTWFKPRHNLRVGTLSHEGARIYLRLVAKHHGQLMAGYHACPCRDCMETAIGGEFCHACIAAECLLDHECLVGHDVDD